MPFKVEFKPIKTAKGDVASIEFRDPIGEDVFDLERSPYRELLVPGDEKTGSGDRVEMVQDGKMLKRWMQRLAPPDLDGSVIGAMPAGAVRAVFSWLVPLLNTHDGEATEKNSPAP